MYADESTDRLPEACTKNLMAKVVSPFSLLCELHLEIRFLSIERPLNDTTTRSPCCCLTIHERGRYRFENTQK